jgi:hypothetical protein
MMNRLVTGQHIACTAGGRVARDVPVGCTGNGGGHLAAHRRAVMDAFRSRGEPVLFSVMGDVVRRVQRSSRPSNADPANGEEGET